MASVLCVTARVAAKPAIPQRAPSIVAMAIFYLTCCPPGVAQSSKQETGWKWGLEFIENYDSRGRQKKAPQAWTPELSGKGHSLMLIRCKGGYLAFVDGPEDDFWSGDPPLSGGDDRVGWINDHPVIMGPGQDGYYFNIDVSDDGAFRFLLKERYMNI